MTLQVDGITQIDGIKVGHVTHADARTGCTAVLLPDGCVVSGEVRGGAPATREFALLAPERLVSTAHAIVLSGGSAFGLAACDGVVRWLDEHGQGFVTPHGVVPIVVGMSLYDLGVGEATVRPTAADGFEAATAASSSALLHGLIGAGCGATVDKWAGGVAQPSGIGSAIQIDGELKVAAMVAVNAAGSIDPATADQVSNGLIRPGPPVFGNTTLAVVVPNARLDKGGCFLVSQGGHDGFARAIFPAHQQVDGDAVVTVATGSVDAPLDWVRSLATLAVSRAISSLA